jgi:predicted metal-dependent HD superfamily phosphohydrolase
MDQQRFEQLWARCALEGVDATTIASACYSEIDTCYRESHRYYHRPVHILHCLEQFDSACSLMEQPDLVELAIWYHDVIYVCGDKENELNSAELFKAHAQNQFSSEDIGTVYELIMVTTHDKTLPSSVDQGYVVDIDLSSFGLPWEKFLADSKAVREEFKHLSDEEFYPGQSRFFEMLLSREHFCFTEFFRNRHESQARENIERYMSQLREQGCLPAKL